MFLFGIFKSLLSEQSLKVLMLVAAHCGAGQPQHCGATVEPSAHPPPRGSVRRFGRVHLPLFSLSSVCPVSLSLHCLSLSMDIIVFDMTVDFMIHLKMLHPDGAFISFSRSRAG